MNALGRIIHLESIIKEEVVAYRAMHTPYTPYAVLIPKAFHFIERFDERVGNDPELFRKVIKAFLGMLQVRRKFFVDYVAKHPTFSEHTYMWKGYEIKFSTTLGIRNPEDDEGKCAVIKLQTIIKK